MEIVACLISMSLTHSPARRHTLRLLGRIMIIDDDVALLRFTSKYLARLGYSISTYRSGEQAWQEFSAPEAGYGLVMIDLSLAGLQGEKLSQMMLNANPDVRLILTSGYPFDTRKLF